MDLLERKKEQKFDQDTYFKELLKEGYEPRKVGKCWVYVKPVEKRESGKMKSTRENKLLGNAAYKAARQQTIDKLKPWLNAFIAIIKEQKEKNEIDS